MPPLAAHPPDTDVDFLDRKSCLAFGDRRRARLASDEDALNLAADELMRSQKEAAVQGLCKLNKDVRKMTVDEFNQAFGCDIVELVKRQMAAGDVGFGPGGGGVGGGGAGTKRPATATKANAASGAALRTPAAHMRTGRAPMTRTARRGERIICTSVNGSPVDQFDRGEMVVTAKKRRAAAGGVEGAAGSAADGPISIGIGAGNGETIDLADPVQRRNLDGKQRAQAKRQLLAIQEQMNKLMADF